MSSGAAGWLHRALETYRFPKRLRGRDSALGPIADRLAPVFQDRAELASSANLAESVWVALEQASSLVVICSHRDRDEFARRQRRLARDGDDETQQR